MGEEQETGQASADEQGADAARNPNVYFFSFASRPGARKAKSSYIHTGLDRATPAKSAILSLRSNAPVMLS